MTLGSDIWFKRAVTLKAISTVNRKGRGEDQKEPRGGITAHVRRRFGTPLHFLRKIRLLLESGTKPGRAEQPVPRGWSPCFPVSASLATFLPSFLVPENLLGPHRSINPHRIRAGRNRHQRVKESTSLGAINYAAAVHYHSIKDSFLPLN